MWWLLLVSAFALDEAPADGRLELWQRGIHEFECSTAAACPTEVAAAAKFVRALPVLRHRGGASAEGQAEAVDYGALTDRLGPRFAAALALNEEEHERDCAKSCDVFYCAPAGAVAGAPVETRSISMGSVPPEDFASDFRYPLDLIKVTKAPLFSADEAARAIALARSEGVDGNEYTSGKYKLGGDWITKMPQSLAWFNGVLESSIFPAIAASFPEVVSGAHTLRAHSVALLKYNSTHPRTDVHIDNGVLALTLALSPRSAYAGGGTFFEHLGEGALVEMDAGFATWRPGSVRHGGHRVTQGERYIVGAFLLLSDRVEHVRRLKNRGAELRTAGDVEGAIELFDWALAVNSRCATCLKDSSEARSVLALGAGSGADALLGRAEADLQQAIDLLPSDSDALFSLGVLLSRRGKAAEALEAYERAAAVNADDAELLFNLGVKLGEADRPGDERRMLHRALEADSKFSRARTNLGASYAEAGDLANAETQFAAACEAEPLNAQAWQNLALLLQQRGALAARGVGAATSRADAAAAAEAADACLAGAERAWRAILGLDDAPPGAKARLAAVLQLRGRAAAVYQSIKAALAHFLEAAELAPDESSTWAALARLHDLDGDAAASNQAALNARRLAPDQ
ncbi:hypothetical protein M885DRAFT_545870 [Pelagophyceae sp. CCMP2097]|nr:hypothetical protein M885DRAFT_545870 [Pelagophyceae sp. CCMP2097]